MKTLFAIISTALIAAAVPAAIAKEEPKAKTVQGTITFFHGQKFTGNSYRVDGERTSLKTDFLIGSMAVHPGDKWEVCDKPKFKGNCNVITGDEIEIGKAIIRSARPAS